LTKQKDNAQRHQRFTPFLTIVLQAPPLVRF
jgi:hypothetical protein